MTYLVTPGAGAALVAERQAPLGRWHPVLGWAEDTEHGAWLPHRVLLSLADLADLTGTGERIVSYHPDGVAAVTAAWQAREERR
jgi:hypothetical protein